MVRWPLGIPLRSLLTSLIGVVAFVLVGCGGDSPQPGTPVIEQFEVSPSHLEAPGDVVLSWRTSGATTLELLRGDAPVDLEARSPVEDSIVLAVDETTTFTLIARRAGLAATLRREVQVDPLVAPSIAELTAPAFVEVDTEGEAAATIAWAGVERAEALRLEAPGRAALELDPSAAEGSVEVLLSEDTTFTLVAESPGGEARRSVTIRIAHAPVIESFTADRLRVGSGEEAALHWVTTGAVYVEIWLGEVQLLEEGAPEGSESIPLLLDATLELRAINEVGTTAIATLEIEVGPPSFEELDLSAEALWMGESLSVSWRTLGGSRLDVTLTSTGETICEVQDLDAIAESSCTWQPTEIGFDTIDLLLENLSGVASETLDFFAGDGPLITLFGASPEAHTLGDELEISWAAAPDPSGNEPTLSLTDDRGGSHPLPAGSSGIHTLILPQTGPFELRLVATTEDPRSNPDEATVSIVVEPNPVVTLEALPEVFDDSLFDEVILSWTTLDAETLILYRLEGGEQVQVLEILGEDRAEGSYSFVPNEPARYRLVGSNAIGSQAVAEVDVDLAPTEVLSISASPTSFAQGQEVHLSWTARMADEVRINFATGEYLLEETPAPYLDVAAMGDHHVPLTDDCGLLDTLGCASVLFPSGFTFPFGGLSYPAVWIHTTGYLSFGPLSAPASVPLNEAFPTSAAPASISIAPFWDSLGWDLSRYPSGNIHAALLEEEGQRIFVIQWKDVGYSTAFQKASFNFEVALREDGSFDFRYGKQSANGTNIPSAVVSGGSATIGFQLPDQSDHGQLLFNGTGSINGLRDNRTFSYRPLPPLPPIGELVFRPLGPQASFPVTITAIRGEVSHSLSEMLHVVRKPILELVPEVLEPVVIEEEFLIGWRSSNAQSVEVLDQEGTIRCSATTQAEVDEGICGLSELDGGTYEFTVRAAGAFGTSSERTITATIYGAFGVASFTSPVSSVEQGDSVELRWLTFATESVSLLANGVEIYSDESGDLTGSFIVEDLKEETEFTLIATNDLGATDEASLTIGIWPVVFDIQASRTKVRAGEEVTVTFDARSFDEQKPLRVYGVLPMIEIPGDVDRFLDISGHEDVQLLQRQQMVQEVELPFAFPYMGETYEKLTVTNAGYISFKTGLFAAQANNYPLPATESESFAEIHLAPFWESLSHRNAGDFHVLELDEDTFIIQWTRQSITLGSTNSFPQNLNFQIVLRRDGSFDYRYGTMEPHPTHQATIGQCNPTSCINEVNGSAATIGYQKVDASSGYTHHHGGRLPGPFSHPFPGGLGNRTFRYSIFEGAGSLTFRPSWSVPLTLCVDLDGEPFCKERPIEVPFGFNSISLSEHKINSGESVTLSWETEGGRSLRILDGDQVVFSTTDLAEVDSGSALLTPTKTTTYDIELSGGGRSVVVQQVLELDRFVLTASATTSAGPGAPVTVSWNLAGGADLDLYVFAPMVEIPNDDFAFYDISNDPDAAVLIGANQNNRNVRLDFEGDFTFSYFGTEHAHVQVNTDGYLGWVTTTSAPANNRFPIETGPGATVAIAPFWDDLHTRLHGRVLAKRLDPDRYVIQWSRVSLQLGTSDSNAGDLNFLVVLHRDGTFEYRFGQMLPPQSPVALETYCNPLHCLNETNGSAATIGYQVPGTRSGHTVHFESVAPNINAFPVPGGLGSRAWRFTPHTSTGAGSVVVNPTKTTHYKICAYEAGAGEVSCAPTLLVEVPWGIDLFEINPRAPLAGQPVTLSWSVQGLDWLRILADGVALLHQDSEVQLLGSLDHAPSGTTTYVLEGASMGRMVKEERIVHLRAFDLTVTGPSGVFEPGDAIEVEWELVKHVPDDVVMITPMTELEIGPNGEDGFVDISQLEGAVELTLGGFMPENGFADVDIPFTFPYLGTNQDSLQVFADGYISFAGNGGESFGANGPLPDEAFPRNAVHLAPFWDDLVLRGGDSIWRHSPDANTLIIQWKGFSRAQGSSESVRYDLNFQVVLRSDGSFDYRYGTMAPPAPPFSQPGCNPDDCSSEANGSSATIGYQTADARYGSILHLGSLFSPAGDRGAREEQGGGGFLAFPGGLSNRSFRYFPALKASARVVVGRTSDHEVCAIIGDFAECKSIRSSAVANQGELAITEMMIDPSIGQQGQWVEIRNLTTRPIDLEGFELRSRQGSHTIVGSLSVAPSGFVTLANSTQVPFTPDYVYDGGVPLNRLIDRLEVLIGEAVISSVSWGLGWQIPRDQVLSLDPSLHIPGTLKSPDFEGWCSTGPHGSPGTLGDSCLNPWYIIDPAADHPFIDIGGTGTRIHELEENNVLVRLPSPGFPITLFGESYFRVWGATNGWLSFFDQTPTLNPGSVPPNPVPRTEQTAGIIQAPLFAGLWDRLYCHEHCRIFYEVREVGEEKVMIVQWEDFYLTTISNGTNGMEGSISLQLQVWEGGDLAVVFGQVDNPYIPGNALWAVYEGSNSVSFLEGDHPSFNAVGHNRYPRGLNQRAIHYRAR